MPFGAALTRNNVAGAHGFATKIFSPRRWPAVRGRCVRIRLLSCVPSARLRNVSSWWLHRIRDKSVTSPITSLASGRRSFAPRGNLFALCGNFGPSPSAASAAPASMRVSASTRTSAAAGLPGSPLTVGQSFGDAKKREFLAMADLTPRIFTPALLERDDLRAAPCSSTSAATVAPPTIGAPSFMLSPPTTSTSPNSTISPGSPLILSTLSTSSAATRYCLPPV